MSYKLKYTGQQVQDLLEQVDKGQGGAAVNVVQTTGTSTTDVMSQDAVTKNIPTKISQLTNDTGTVTQIKVNGVVYTADSSGLVDLGAISGGEITYNSTGNNIY